MLHVYIVLFWLVGAGVIYKQTHIISSIHLFNVLDQPAESPRTTHRRMQLARSALTAMMKHMKNLIVGKFCAFPGLFGHVKLVLHISGGAGHRVVGAIARGLDQNCWAGTRRAAIYFEETD